ncbi:MAG: hypothetical protein HLUCCA11_18320 [Phormidesmis priestleyi Ana]|uniref:Uncharacterized protein n=1 Tax=Phormidesmis priestleyi Ana TaxID=1666911 RepID=A0A0N8KME1_9CYAN|nr:MAG: hypothetical protein HLUCCA11_18320 [Phormidesmis priestleyi Ana]
MYSTAKAFMHQGVEKMMSVGREYFAMGVRVFLAGGTHILSSRKCTQANPKEEAKREAKTVQKQAIQKKTVQKKRVKKAWELIQ